MSMRRVCTSNRESRCLGVVAENGVELGVEFGAEEMGGFNEGFTLVMGEVGRIKA